MSHLSPAFWAVIPAAGVGARMAADRPKQYLQLGGRSILEHSISCFLDHPGLKGLVVSVAHARRLPAQPEGRQHKARTARKDHQKRH